MMQMMRLKHWNAGVVVMVGERHELNCATECREGMEVMVRMSTMTCASDVDGVVLGGVRVHGVVGSSGSDV